VINYVELPDTQLAIPIVAGPAETWHAVLPSLRRPGEVFHLGIKAEDKWGNPTAQARATLQLQSTLPVTGLPTEIDYSPDDRALSIEGLRVEEPGTLRLTLLLDGRVVAEAGPLVVREGTTASFWGDLHGQTGETVGTNTIESYLDFARNKAFLDVTSHQANDFQITIPFWQRLNELTKEFNEPGRFTVLPGYEWSGNTAVGGDHNVFFREEGRPIRRCSHALLEDRSDTESDAHTLTDLYQAFRDTNEDVVMYAHVGGRYANIHYDHDALIETAVEMHSAWGTFEWILLDGFPMKRRVGVVCNSDGHKGRPGASYPGDSIFGAYGGLTCFLTERNDRDSIMEAQRRRHHYGTTGCRLHMDVAVNLSAPGTLFERNPDADPSCQTHQVDTAMMGDIVHIRVLWSGAEYRGRGRNTQWIGRAQFSNATIANFKTINQWNPDALFEQRGSDTVIWKTVTTGNFMGFDAWITEPDIASDARLHITTNLGELDLNLSQIGFEDTTHDAGGLERKIKTYRLPEKPLQREMKFSRTVSLDQKVDNPIWICATTEDGYQAWSSPVYLFT